MMCIVYVVYACVLFVTTNLAVCDKGKARRAFTVFVDIVGVLVLT